MLHRGEWFSNVTRMLYCARASVGCWMNWFMLFDAEIPKTLTVGRSRYWHSEHIGPLLFELIKYNLGDFGFQHLH